MRALACVLLCALLLLPFARGDAPAPLEGEWCRLWAFPGWMFRCPRRTDGAAARFCCGSCSRPYCCSSKEARLDQQRCPRPVPPGGGITKDPRNNPPGSSKPPYSWTIFFSFISFLVGITFLLVVRHCKETYGPRMRTFWHDNVVEVWNRNRNQAREAFQMGVYHVPVIPEPIPDPLLHPPPPNVTIVPPNADNPQEKWAFSPSAFAAFFHSVSAENMEGEATIGSLVHRHVPSQASDSASEKETSV